MMQSVVPVTGEYALRAMICLAAMPPGEWMPAHDLAAQAHVPSAFLSKVLRRLVQGGLLEAQKGHHGGFRLARPPGSIRVMEVMEAVDIGFLSAHCAFGFAQCNAAAPCPLHDMYRDLQQMCRMWARAHTLQDVDLSRLPGRGAAEPDVAVEADGPGCT